MSQKEWWKHIKHFFLVIFGNNAFKACIIAFGKWKLC